MPYPLHHRATAIRYEYTVLCRAVSPQKMVQQILALKPEQQLQVFTMLQDALTKRGLLGDGGVADDNNDNGAVF